MRRNLKNFQHTRKFGEFPASRKSEKIFQHVKNQRFLNMISKTKIAKRLERKTNPLLREMIIMLKKQKEPFWIRIADLLSRPDMYVANLEKLEKLTNEKDNVIVPGKVLASGSLNHPVKISAFSISQSALNKLNKSKSQFMSIQEMLKQNPKGKDVKIII